MEVIFFIMFRNRMGEKRFRQNVTKHISFTERFTMGSYCIHQLRVMPGISNQQKTTTTRQISYINYTYIIYIIVLMYDILYIDIFNIYY